MLSPNDPTASCECRADSKSDNPADDDGRKSKLDHREDSSGPVDEKANDQAGDGPDYAEHDRSKCGTANRQRHRLEPHCTRVPCRPCRSVLSGALVHACLRSGVCERSYCVTPFTQSTTTYADAMAWPHKRPSSQRPRNRVSGWIERETQKLMDRQSPEQALETAQSILQWGVKKGGSDSALTINAMTEVADNLMNLGRTDEEVIMRGQIAEATRQSLGSESRVAVNAEFAYAICLARLGRYEEAEPLIAHVMTVRSDELGQEDPSTLRAMSWGAHVAGKLGKLEVARLLQENVLVTYQRLGQGETAAGVKVAINLSTTLIALHDPGEAATLLRHAVEVRRQTLGEDDPATLDVMQALATALWMAGEVTDAQALAQGLAEKRSLALGEVDKESRR